MPPTTPKTGAEVSPPTAAEVPPSVVADLQTRLQQGFDTFHHDLRKAAEGIKDLIAEAESLGLWQIYGKAHHLLANIAVEEMRLEEGCDLEEKALHAFARAGDTVSPMASYNTLSIIYSRHGNYGDSIAYLLRAKEIAQAANRLPAMANIECNIGLDLAYLGHLEEGLRHLQDGLQHWREAQSPSGIATALINLGFVSSKLNDHEASIAYNNEVLQTVSAEEHPRTHITALRNLSDAHLELGNLDLALKLACESTSLARTQGDPMRLAQALEALGHVQSALDRPEEARNSLNEALSIYRQGGINRGIALALKLLAQLCPTESAARREALLEGVGHLEASGSIEEQASFHELISESHRAAGQFDQALEHLRKHHEIERRFQKDRADQRSRLIQARYQIERVREEASIHKAANAKLEEALRMLEVERARAEEESRQKSEILRIAAHDLRNLTAGVLGSARMLHDMVQEGDPGNEPFIRDLAETAFHAARNLHEVLLGLLDASAIESGKFTFTFVNCDLSALLQQALMHWKTRATEKSQSISVHAPPEAPGRADPVRLGSLFDNLISNAIKYSPIGGTVGIRLAEFESGWMIEVRDSSHPIPESDLHRLFTPFQRLAVQPTGNEVSIGLGLSIVRRIVDAHHGTIEVLPGEGSGNLFRVTLPSNPTAPIG